MYFAQRILQSVAGARDLGTGCGRGVPA